MTKAEYLQKAWDHHIKPYKLPKDPNKSFVRGFNAGWDSLLEARGDVQIK